MGAIAESLDSAVVVDAPREWRTPCLFGEWFRSLDEEDSAAVRRIFASSMTHVEVAEKITDAGYTVSNDTISRHRRKNARGACRQCRDSQTI